MNRSNETLEIVIDGNCAGATSVARKKGDALNPLEQRILDQAKAGSTMAWAQYDRVVVAFSGGKDSLAAVLHIIDQGCPKEKIDLWHHEIDGREETEAWMDWPSTPSYCHAVADELGLPLRFSWRKGGFKGEVLKENTTTAPVNFDLPDGTVGTAGGKGKPNTRKMFPAMSASLQTRWCSALLKIDVADFAFRGDTRFSNKDERYMVITGERREESNNRAKYAEAEYHRTACKSRNLVHWRAVIDWTEQDVWAIIERHQIAPHPAYRAGFGRCSCAFCIFGNSDQFATGCDLLPSQFDAVAKVEQDIGFTMQPDRSLTEHADRGTSFATETPQKIREACASTTYELPIVDANWELPAGAFKDTQNGPV